MKYLLSILFLLFSITLVFSNTAQPGMWQAGGMGNFSLLYPGDSLAYQQIQMAKERIAVHLYPGFAVVHGEYWMQNDTEQNYTIHTGYPINSMMASEESRKLMQVNFDDLYGIRVLVNGEEMRINRDTFENDSERYEGNWYVWKNEFPKQSTTKIEVFFLMDTNQAIVRQGYQKTQQNGFIYLLETGAIWKQPIGDGALRLQLQEGLTVDDLSGIFPNDFFQLHEETQILHGKFKALQPTYKDNVVIRYGQRLANFDFKTILEQKMVYFEKIKTFSQQDLTSFSFIPIEPLNPFEVKSDYILGKPYNFFLMAVSGILMLILGFYFGRKLFQK